MTRRASKLVVMAARLAVLPAMFCAAARAQEPVGSVSLKDATVTGELAVSGGRAKMLGATTVTAGDHTAELDLTRGGAVEVCATSVLHVTSGRAGTGEGASGPPLLLALDRGAVEVHMRTGARDAVMTPDMRFGVESEGMLDLRIRMTSNGDTCVESRGVGAPALTIHDQFGDSSYQLRGGQHVLFEHGSLKEVVDHESSPCGCPAASVVSVADAGVSSGAAAAAVPGSGVSAAAQHPFPAAESQGLTTKPAGAAAVPQAPAGDVHTQVAATMTFNADGGGANGTGRDGTGAAPAPVGAGKAAAAASPGAAISPTTAATAASAGGPGAAGGSVLVAGVRAQAPVPEAPPAPSPGGLGHRIGRFFRRIFGRG